MNHHSHVNATIARQRHDEFIAAARTARLARETRRARRNPGSATAAQTRTWRRLIPLWAR